MHVSEVGAPTSSTRPARGERAPALRRRVRRPLGRARAGSGGERPGGRRRRPRPRVFPDAGPREPPRLLPARGRDALYGRLGRRPHPAEPVRAPRVPSARLDVEAWFRTFDEIERRRPARLALIHFGVADSPSEHLALIRQELTQWAERGRESPDVRAWVQAARRDLEAAVGADEADHWERAAPLWQSYVGMRRYWDKRSEPAGSAHSPSASSACSSQAGRSPSSGTRWRRSRSPSRSST